jgi:uncharacterized repeat protein (TIGR01451 family)
MHSRPIHHAALVAAFSFAASALAAGFTEKSPIQSANIANTQPTEDLAVGLDGKANYFIQLADSPAAVVYADDLGRLGVTNTALAISHAQSQAAKLRQSQQRVMDNVQKAGIATEELYRLQRALNGVAVRLAPADVARVRAIAGVKAILPIAPEEPVKDDAVAFTNSPKLWTDTLGLGKNLDGSGLKIGIIDTGIDYIHSDFGGTGLLADYQANAVDPTPYFPSAKVVGGIDFAGDAYTGSNAPSPGPSPMDCLGHGSHVAGIAAGFGVNSDGSTYSGQYGVSTPFAALSINPGTAPKAKLYAIRVFGCGGSTGLTPQGIDWAIDPNGDDDFSDHLDVINMSLGSNFGTLNQVSSLASENAARVGVIVVASAGNAGDTFYVSGSPGSSTRTLTVAASLDDNQAAPSVHVNTPPAIAGDYVAGAAVFGPLPNGLTGNVVVGIDPADGSGPLTTDACSPLTNAAAVAGNIALVDRGTCGFTVKVKNAQNAGAIAVLVANSASGVFGGLGGTDNTITIPSAMITFADGNTFKANIAGLNVTMPNGADTLATFSSRGPRGQKPDGLKPDIAAPGQNITSAQSGHTCTAAAQGCLTPAASGFIPGNAPLILSGTSMAAPHAAGVMALLRQEHPDWNVEQLKALAMNYAVHDVTVFPSGTSLHYAPSRAGSGRVDAATAAVGNVLAFNADDPGAVSIAFDPEVTISSTQTRMLHIVNNGSAFADFDVAIENVVDAPGVSFSLPGGSVGGLAGGGSTDIAVQMHADATQLKHTFDPTLALTQTTASPLALTLPRHWLTEEQAYVTFRHNGDLLLRVPVYMSPRPASTVEAAGILATGGAATGSSQFIMSGVGVCTGSLDASPSCSGSFPTDEESTSSAFELQVSQSAQPAAVPGFANIQYAGVTYDAGSNLIEFGISTFGDWGTSTDVTFNVCVDVNKDNVYDRILFNSNPGSMDKNLFGVTTANPTDSFVSAVLTTGTSGVSLGTYINGLSAATVDTAVLRNNVLFLAATPAQLGLSTGASSFQYRVVACPGFNTLCAWTGVDNCSPGGNAYDIASGPYAWDYQAPGLSFDSAPYEDLNGSSIPVSWNTANLATNGSLGALVLHHLNKAGTRAQAIVLQGTPSSDVSVSLSTDKATVPVSQTPSTVTLTVTANNAGPADASNVAVAVDLPAGLDYVSDDSGGAYDNATGLWTLTTLAANASATVHITATVSASGTLTVNARRVGGTPIDTNPANDNASVSINSPTAADLVVAVTNSGSSLTIPGTPVTYTITISNLGPNDAFGVHVATTYVPGPVTADSFTASAGSFDPATGVWSIASLPAPTTGGTPQTQTLQITFTYPSSPPTLTVTATATSDTAELDTATNTRSITIDNDRIFSDGFE